MSGFGVDFGQKVDLTASIRNILRNYPEGTAILKELVQNADDAGAKRICFTLDLRTHGVEKLASPSLAPFQGPSLAVYNDETFSPQDFESIQRIGDSLKKTDGAPKIGRFGIGFNAVYHWTDLPSFVSSRYLVLLDPQAKFLPDVNPSNPGKMVDFVGSPELLTSYRDQFEPYVGYVGSWSKPFSGTLFRLPLRTPELGTTSRLSNRVLDVDTATDVLQSLVQEANSMLLFLKNVLQIEVKIWRAGEPSASHWFTSSIANVTPDLMSKRQFVMQVPVGSGPGPGQQGQKQSAGAGGNAAGQAVSFNSVTTADFNLEILCKYTDKEPYTEVWDVCNQFGGGSAARIASLPTNALLKLIPWGGVAALISSNRPAALVSGAGTNVNADDISAIVGQAYCFLPLPIQTDLPVMVNGYFELSSNRRDIWQAGTDMTGDGKTRAEWNIALMTDVIAPSYVRLLARARTALQSFSPKYQSLWPSTKLAAPWNNVSVAMYRLLKQERLLYTDLKASSGGGALIDTIGAGFSSLMGAFGATDAAKAVAVTTSQQWIACGTAIVFPVVFKNVVICDADEAMLHRLFIQKAKLPLVLCSSKIRDGLIHTDIADHVVSPRYLRSVLGNLIRQCVSSMDMAVRNNVTVNQNQRHSQQNERVQMRLDVTPFLGNLPMNDWCRFLLRYCLSDCQRDTAPAELNMLPILPLLSGSQIKVKVKSNSGGGAAGGYNDATATVNINNSSAKTSANSSAIGTLRIFSAQETQSIHELSSMGFSTSQSLQALTAYRFDLDAACDSLTGGGSGSGSARPMVVNDDNSRMDRALRGDAIFVICNSDEEVEVFQSSSHVLLDKANIDPNELKFLVNPAMQKYSNIRPFSPALIPDLLRAILPEVCFSQSKYVSIKHLSNCDKIYEFIKVFFNYCSSGSRGEAVAAVAEGIAIVPSRSGLLYPLSKVSTLVAIVNSTSATDVGTSAASASELRSSDNGPDSSGSSYSSSAGGISAELEDLLTIMGCNFIDSSLVFAPSSSSSALVPDSAELGTPSATATATTTAIARVSTSATTAIASSSTQASVTSITRGGQMPKKFWEYVYSTASLMDMLTVFDIIQRSNHLFTFQSRLRVDDAPGADAGARSGAGAGAAVGKVTASQLDALRMFIINGLTNNTSLSDTNIRVLRRLPIYISHQSRSYISLITAASASAQVPLDARPNMQYYTLTDPSKIPAVLLTDDFLVHDARYPQELQLLQKLGVQRLSKCQYYKNHFLPNLQNLFAAYPTETTAVLVLMISEMGSLVSEDRAFALMLKNVPFVPVGSPSQKQQCAGDASVSVAGSTPASVPIVELKRPSELYDPEQVEVVSLLPIASFPCAEFCRTDILLTLRQFGMRTVMDWEAILICAKGIQDMSSDTNTPLAGPVSDGDGDGDDRASVSVESPARVKVDRAVNLLKFLDKNGRTLFGPPTEAAEAAAKAARRSSTSLVGSLYTSFFGDDESTIKAAAADAQKLVEQKKYVTALRDIAWVPVATTLDDCWSYLPVRYPVALTAKPSESRPIGDAPMCSGSCYLISQTIRSSDLLSAFGWDGTFSPLTIALQLREIAKMYVTRQKEEAGESAIVTTSPSTVSSYPVASASGSASGSAPGSGCPKMTMDDVRESISGVIPQLYAKLNTISEAAGSASTTVTDVVSMLDNSDWIWVGDTFVSSDKVALNVSVNAAPYLFQLPQDLCVYKRLLHIFHVKSSFTPRDYMQVLRTMMDEHRVHAKVLAKAIGSAGAGKNDVTPLSESKLELAIALITLLAADSNASKNQVVYIPDQQGRLRLAEDLVNDDVPWMFGPECASIRSGKNFIHPNISTAVSEKFGVKSLRLVLLNQNVEQNIFAGGGAGAADGNSGALEAFGQAESITNRLKTILDLYPEGNPIYSELIQNADDAGATVVKIMLDENSYGSESLLSQKMAPLQGPSLLVYNDALFTEADYRALGRIGQGSKLEKLSTTGRFGLGFNSTYHLTDMPSFVSGDYLVIFDPHCSYAPGATTNQPGLRIKCSSGSDAGSVNGKGSANQLTVTFKDQFEPFKHFDCDFKSSYNGTLFRFPLRTSSLARQSEISKRHYNASDILGSLDQLIDNVSNHLLFLRNLRTIEIYRHKAGATGPTLLYRAQARVSGYETVSDQSLLKFFAKTPTAVMNNVAGGGHQSRDSFYNKLLATPDGRLPLEFFRMKIICSNYRAPKGATIEDPSMSAGGTSASTEVLVTDGSGTASDDASPVVVDVHMVEYFIASGLCGGAAKKMACDEKNRHLKLVPMGAIAACISRTEQVNGKAITTVFPALNGTAFCFLPLPVTTQLPVHVNAYWELSSNRRDIWHGDDTTGEAKLRSDWNNCVARDVLSTLYAKLLNRLSVAIVTPVSSNGNGMGADTVISTRSKYDILNLLPCPLPQQGTWRMLGEHVLPLIAESCLIMWSNLKKGTYLSLADSILLLRSASGKFDAGAGVVGPDASNELMALENSNTNANMMATNTFGSSSSGTASANAISGNLHGQGSEDTKFLDRLENLLLREALPVVVVNAEVGNTLIKQQCVRGYISPAFVRAHFSTINSQFRHPSIDAGPSLDKETAVGNAVFLLQYAFRDVNRDNFDALHTVKLLPLEDGSLGAIQVDAAGDGDADSRSNCYFTVTDLERKILQEHCGGRLVVADSVLGTHVASCLRDPQFNAGRNVKPLGLRDMVTLLQQIIPSEWSTPGCAIVNRDGVFSNDWLCNLWNYLIDNECRELDFMPLLPVLQPKSMPKGAYMVRVSSKIPILLINNNTAASIDSDVTDALSDLGLYVFDSSVLGRLSFAKDIDSVLCNPTPQGLLDGLTTVCTAQCFHYSSEVNVKWTARTRNVLRNFILDYIVSKMELLSLDEAAVLWSLPIWLVHGYKTMYVPNSEKGAPNGAVASGGSLEDSLEAYRSFSIEDLESRRVLLPPATVEKDLLTHKYLKIRSEFDRVVYRSMHVEECSSGTFYALDVIPHLTFNETETNTTASVTTSNTGSTNGRPAVASDGDARRKSELEQSSGKISVELLRNLSQLESEQPGISDLLQQTAFISNSSGKLSRPVDLYDPDISDLKVLLPPECFPMRALYDDPVCLNSLRRLGIHTVLDCAGVLKVASSIAADFDAYNAAAKAAIPVGVNASSVAAASPSSAQVTMIVTKGMKLLKYLDAHMESLLAEADPVGLQSLKDKQNQLLDAGTPESDTAAAGNGAVGGAWGQELRELIWVPTQIQAPLRELVEYLPWPARTHASFLGAPLQTCLPENVWLCSRAFKVSAVDVKSEFVRAVLGWSLPVPGRIAALQLLSIQHQLASLVNNNNRNASTVLVEMNKGRLLEREIFRLYDCLQAALSEGEREVSVWLNALKNKPIIWVQTSGGYNMLESARVAFEPLSRNISTEPFLYVVNSELIAYTSLLQRVGVRAAFVPMDIANLLRDMKAKYVEKSLSVAEADMCVGLLKVLTRFLEGDAAENGGSEEEGDDDEGDGDDSGDRDGGGAAVAVSAVVVAKAVPVGVAQSARMHDSDDECDDEGQPSVCASAAAVTATPIEVKAINASSSPSSSDKPDSMPNKKDKPEDERKQGKKPKNKKPAAAVDFERVTLSSLGNIFIPDTTNVLVLASNLTFNDAEWTKKTPSLLTQHKSIRFVKELLDNKSALLLGCKSFREQLFSGDSIACPGAHILRSIIADDGADDVIKDLISMADNLRCHGLHVFYDQRTHPVESLLHPGLADTQGPALVCFMEGPVIDSERITKLLSVPELMNSGSDASVDEGGGGNEGHSATPADYLKKIMQRYPKPGKGIASAFTICDCLQILSGNSFHVYDPCGLYLWDAHDCPQQDGAREHSAKAQKCALVARSTCNASEQINALQRFPDQFGPILNLPYGTVQSSLKSKNYLDGIVIRMPLRKTRSHLCGIVPTEAMVKGLLVNYRHMLEGSLLFAYTLIHGSCKHVLAPLKSEEVDSNGDSNSSSSSSNATVRGPQQQSVDDFELSLLSAPEKRNQRLSLLVDKSWKSGGLTSMFSKAFVPLEINYDIVVALKFAVNNHRGDNSSVASQADANSNSYLDWSNCCMPASATGSAAPVVNSSGIALGKERHDSLSLSATHMNSNSNSSNNNKPSSREFNNIWKIMSMLGPKRTRGEANRSAYSAAKLVPIISAAVLLSAREAEQSPATPPPIGFYYNFGGIAAVSGLPVHFEGPFLQYYPTRELPLPVPSCTRPEALERRGSLGSSFGNSSSSRRRSSVSSGYQHQLLSGDQIRTWNSCMLHDLLYLIYPQYLELLRDKLFSVPVADETGGGSSSASSNSNSTNSSGSASANSVSALTKSVRMYRYWPFLARLRPSTREYLLQCGFIENLVVTRKLLLVKNGFESLDNVVVMTARQGGGGGAVSGTAGASGNMNTTGISPSTKEYICNYLSLTYCPMQLTNELIEHSIVHNFKRLTSSRLRDALRRDGLGHCRRLQKRHELVLEMLRYCVFDMVPESSRSGSGSGDVAEALTATAVVTPSSDTYSDALSGVLSTINGVASAASSTTSAAVGDFARQALYKELIGVPLLITADNSVKPFPATARDRVVRVSSTLQALMPQLANEFIHPLLLQAVPLFNDMVFREALSISDFSPTHILENIHLILPSKWRRCGAVEWDRTVTSLSTRLASASSSLGGGFNCSATSGSGAVHSVNPLFIYILWRDILSRQDYGALDLLADWPLLPVTSNGKHMLISPALLPYVTPSTSTATQDITRMLLARESARLASVVDRDTARMLQHTVPGSRHTDSGGVGAGSGADWMWATMPAFVDTVSVGEADTLAPAAKAGNARSLPTAAPVSNTQVVTATAVDAQPGSFTALFTGSSTLPALDGAVPVAEVQELESEQNRTAIAGNGAVLTAGAAINGEMRASRTIPAPLLSVLERVGMPMLDCSFFDGLPAVLQSGMDVTVGKRMLESMYELQRRDLVVFADGYHSSGSDSGSGGSSSIADGGATRTADNGNVTAQDSLLNFDVLSISDRREVLREIFNAHRTSPFPTSDINKLKSLRLFTSSTGSDDEDDSASSSRFNFGATTSSGLPVASRPPIAIDSANGVFWSRTAGALEGLTLTSTGASTGESGSGRGVTGGVASLLLGPSFSSSSATRANTDPDVAAAPVVLVNDSSLRDIYDLVGAEELTPAIAVKRFTIPALKRMDPIQRHEIMKRLADKWGSYNADTALVNELKTIAFIPGWCSSEDGEANGHGAVVGFGEICPDKPVRCAKDVLTWTSDGLKQALKGPNQSAYFPPPLMAEAKWFTLLTDLGSTSELDKPKFLRVVTDIDRLVSSLGDTAAGHSRHATAQNYDSDDELDQTQGPRDPDHAVTVMREAFERGTRLLEYIKQDDHTASFLDTEVARKISKLSFVPVMKPVSVGSGGFVQYKPVVVRMNQTLAHQQGALAFSLMPVLEESLAPPQYFFSSLGICTVPPVDVVLKHFRQLINYTGSQNSIRNNSSNINSSNTNNYLLDRWNTDKYSIKDTFIAIYLFLQEHWKEVPLYEREALQTTLHCVPIGIVLAKPTRLFFRLAEDLSPFMHEVPRNFGACEEFLKKCLGIREAPDIADYKQFLQELTYECKDNALNPNELRAVLTIIRTIVDIISNDDAAAGAGAGTGAVDPRKLKRLTGSSSSIFVPDQNSVMQDTRNCVVSDNVWLKSQAMAGLFNLGMHIVHPRINRQFAERLCIPKLSSIVSERIVDNSLDMQAEGLSQELAAKFVAVFERSADLSSAIAALVLKSQLEFDAAGTGTSSSNGNSSATNTGANADSSCSSGRTRAIKNFGGASASNIDIVENIPQILKTIDVKFVPSIHTFLVLRDPRTHLPAPPLAAAGMGNFPPPPPSTVAAAAGAGGSSTEVDLGDCSDPICFLYHHHAADGAGSSSDTVLNRQDKSDAKTTTLLINSKLIVSPLSPEVAISLGLCEYFELDKSIACSLGCVLAACTDIFYQQSSSSTSNISVSTSALGAVAEARTHLDSTAAAGIAGNAGTATMMSNLLSLLHIGCDHTTVQERLRGVPGERLLDCDVAKIELIPNAVFRAGDIVAYSCCDDNDHAGGSSSNGGDTEIKARNKSRLLDTLRYGKVMSVSAPDAVLQMSRIQVKTKATTTTTTTSSSSSSSETGHKWLLSTEVYSFKSARLGVSPSSSSGSGATAAGPNHAMSLNPLRRLMKVGSQLSGGDATAASSSASATGRIGEKTATTIATDAVATTAANGAGSMEGIDVSEALISLMSRAGIPVSLEKQEFMTRILELERQNRMLEAESQQAKNEGQECKRVMNKMQNSFLCEICTTNPVDTVMVPCGHTICKTCVNQLARQKCPFCRADLRSKVKFYLSSSVDDDDSDTATV